jgi:hypothetical protein
MSGPIVYKPLSLAELRALEIPPRCDVVEGLLPKGQVTLFSAREKSGKTLIATDLACAVALDQPFLDRPVSCGTVIFIALEENVREVKHRILDRVGDGYDDEAVPLRVLPANGFTDAVFRLDDEECLAAFAQMIDDYHASLVVIDTMRETHGLRENVSDDMAALVRPLRQIAHAKNCAIVLIHHMSRAGDPRGSTAIAASADQLWNFTRTDREGGAEAVHPAGTLVVEGRFGPPVVLGIRLGDRYRWKVDGAVPFTDLSARDAILRCLREHPDGLTAQEIAAQTKKHLKTIQNESAVLLREQPPPIVAIGNPTKANPRRYRVVDPDLWGGRDPGDIVPPTEPPNPREPGTMEEDRSHGSGNDGNDEERIVPDSRTQGAAGGRNHPRVCYACRTPVPPDGSVCPVCHPPAGSKADDPDEEVSGAL